MSFGYSVNDVLVLIQLSWSTVEGATRACGKHDDLTKEVSSLYDVLAHVYSELSVPDASIGRARSSSKAELQSHLAGCDAQLRIIKAVLDKFNALSAEQKFGKQIWLKVRFANGQDQNLAEIRTSIATYSTAITMSLRLMCLGSRGKVERQLSRQKGSIEGLRESVNLALAHVNASTQQKSLIAAYSNDSKGFWSDLRRELTKDGFSRSSLNSKKDLILSYMKELDSRGVLGYSSTFQKAMEARNETKRQSITPTSFQSSSTLSGGRHSNSSFQSFGYRRDSGYCSSGLEDPVCIRTDSFDPSWSDGRPVTAAAHEQVLYPTPADINVKLDDLCIDSPNTSLPHRTRSQAIPTLVSRTVNDGLVRMQTQQPVVHSPSHRESFTGLAQHRSTNEMEQKIKLEDPRGREFSFPLSQAKTWEGMESLIKKNCAGISKGIVDAHQDEANILPYLWEEVAAPGARLAIRHPCAQLSQPSVLCPPTEEFYLLLESPACPEDDFSQLPTLGDWMERGITEFTPHSEFYEMD